eukprot:XP_014767951.1 PREDICTED: uncharacterized protein LOC106867557 [Octopus bimaculoides]
MKGQVNLLLPALYSSFFCCARCVKTHRLGGRNKEEEEEGTDPLLFMITFLDNRSNILHGHVYYLSRFSRRAKFKSLRKTKTHLCKNQAVITFPRDQCRHSSGVSDTCSSRSGSTESVSREIPSSKTRVTVVHNPTNSTIFNSRDVSQFERSNSDKNNRRASQYERSTSERNHHCFPHRLGRNIGTLFCKSKMLRLGVLLLVLIIWVGVTYSAIKNQSVGNGGQLKQANNTYHPSHQLQESARLNSILVSEFKKAIKTTHTARELIRLFAGKDATREQIDRLLGYELERTYSDRGRFPRMMSGYDDVISGLDKALSHVQEMSSSPLHRCKHPRPEIVYIQDNEAKNRVYFPSCTVIHRCRNVTGCCSNASAVCGPKRVKIISKYFVVRALFSHSLFL